MAPAPSMAHGAGFDGGFAKQPDQGWQSTHPAASAGQIAPGLPTPWPVPTAEQGLRGTATEKFNQQVQEAAQLAGSPCNAGDLARVRATFENALNRDPKRANLRPALDELYQQLQQGQVTAPLQQQLVQYAEALHAGNLAAAINFAQLMVGEGWNKHSKNWLNALKKLASPPSTAPQPQPQPGLPQPAWPGIPTAPGMSTVGRF
ncbi:hypothetical protein GNI_100630 [Gregarina niphandrodes]|uniref:Uncharacterized protein n=1 Tax=Gregarina niphandrodes TaxID=110365 RepID=A0A023B4K1_GRENI|nr:hypothetical protein GNI_100630 [Gregarina niphandrodes]EZG56830.1 hypothetical protein GNI_100630 [Gregarina niphandrodes]|eukprot:XP_011131135.1 hypothetical protein GNI_100630 [Gregarina niphandrodes]